MEQLTTSAYLRFFESKVGLLRGRGRADQATKRRYKCRGGRVREGSMHMTVASGIK